MASAKTMLFGPVGSQVEVPWPLSGMGRDVNLVTETTTLLSGEQAVYRAPVTYKTYNMSWRATAQKLQPIIDVYSGVYGNGPYYITDPVAAQQGDNLLPSKWAASHLLAHVCNGWNNPVVTAQTATPELRQVTFTADPDYPSTFPNPIVVPVIPGQPLYFKAWGSATGGATLKVWRYSKSTQAWSWKATIVPTTENDAPTLVVPESTSSVAVKIFPHMPDGSTLTLQHMDLAVNDYRTYTPYTYSLDTAGFPPRYPALTLYPGMASYPSGPEPTMFRAGMGSGPVQFTGNIGGKLDSVVIDRIGLSIDLMEVSRDPNNT